MLVAEHEECVGLEQETEFAGAGAEGIWGRWGSPGCLKKYQQKRITDTDTEDRYRRKVLGKKETANLREVG